MNEDQNPFVEGEEVLESEQTCWKDAARLCGDECVAYDEKCEDNPLWKPCLLLNLKRAQAKSYANIAAELKRLNDALEGAGTSAEKRAAADALAQKLKETDPGPPEIR
jgi:hypothetical protein